jgi:spore coat polysaccharide biosynthesis protein SpsF
VVGQQSNIKVGFIIQARMTSTRLPGKILLPLPFDTGKPVIKWIIDELKLSSYNGDIIIATSNNSENDSLVDYCKQNSIKYYRGDEENVLSRFIGIIKENVFDVIVRLTGDNPLIDITLLDKTIAYHFSNSNDYTKTEDLPLGMNYEIISPAALLILEHSSVSDYDREHVTPFIKDSNSFKKGIFKLGIKESFKDIRVTIDYPSDYLMLSAIVTVGTTLKLKGIDLIDKVVFNFPWIFEVNNNNIQKKEYGTLKEELEVASSILDNLELKLAANILNSYKV